MREKAEALSAKQKEYNDTVVSKQEALLSLERTEFERNEMRVNLNAKIDESKLKSKF